MASRSLHRWLTSAAKALDEIEAAHAAVGGTERGRRYATQQINQAYAVLLSSRFQGFCRDLHSESSDHLTADYEISKDPRLLLLRTGLTAGRKFDSGNPNPGNIGSDFARFKINVWEQVQRHDPRNARRQKELEQLNVWRNAIAHQNFDPDLLGGRTELQLRVVRRWRLACNGLVRSFEAVMASHLAGILGFSPW
jgi:hypothetical protein